MERSPPARPPGEQLRDRVIDRRQMRRRQARRQRGAESITQQASVLDRSEVLPPGQTHRQDTPRMLQLLELGLQVHALRAALLELLPGERPETAQRIGDLLAAAQCPLGGEPLQALLHLGDHLGVEQLAQAHRAQQLCQQGLVQGEGGRAALGERSVGVVDELCEIAEQQRAREGRGRRRLHLPHLEPAPPHLRHQLHERGQVIDVL